MNLTRVSDSSYVVGFDTITNGVDESIQYENAYTRMMSDLSTVPSANLTVGRLGDVLTQTIPRIKHTEKIFVYLSLFIISSIGNTTAFIALLFMKNSNKSKNCIRIRMLFMNLCIADLMVTQINYTRKHLL